MSRCFPFPPPGYALSIAWKEALIELIKLQKEKEKAEELKKEKKREKKEKRKEKKEKKEKTTRNQDNSDIGEKFWADSKVAPLHKGSIAETEQLEWSNLTEEHAEPVSLRVPSPSSESTENSHKRKRWSSPDDVSRSHGKIIRIRLSSKNASVDEQKHCSTSGRTDFPPQTNNGFCSTSGSQRTPLPPQIDNGFCSTSRFPPQIDRGFLSTSSSTGNVSRSLVLKTSRERIQVASKQIEAASVMTKMQKEGLLYENLIVNRVPPQLQDVCLDDGDMDWLFTSKCKVERSEKRSKCRDDAMSHCSTTSWPRANFLPEVEVYALPFTVPF